MKRYPMSDALTQYNAALPVWSNTATNRLLAANFLKMGSLVESQQEANEIQRQLCGVAEETNSLLRDVGAQLEELSRAQVETNHLLSQSLDVQREQLRMAQRERVLKDALFRWQRIFSLNQGERADVHVDVIASRTLTAFLSKHGFATGDLQDAAEKQQLLDLCQIAAARESQCPPDMQNEVSQFQKLYAEYLDCTCNPPQPTDYALGNPHAARDAYLSRIIKECFGDKWTPTQAPDNYFSTLDTWTAEHWKVTRRWLDERPSLSGIWMCTTFWRERWHSIEVAVKDLLLAPRITALLFTSSQLWIRKGAESSWTQHRYTEDGNTSDLESVSYDKEYQRSLQRLCKAMYAYCHTGAAEVAAKDEASQRNAAAEWKAARMAHVRRLSVMANRINEYIELHPAAADWYPRARVGTDWEQYARAALAMEPGAKDTERLEQQELSFEPLSDERRRWLVDADNPHYQLNKFVGNKDAVQQISRVVFSALGKDNRDCSEHSFALCGPAGTGKTYLANLFAEVLKLPFVGIEAQSIESIEDLFAKIEWVCAEDGRVSLVEYPGGLYFLPPMIVFIDDYHNLRNSVVQGLLHATETNGSVLVTEKGFVRTDKVCWVIATTDCGDLSDAFHARFHKVILQRLSAEEMTQIVKINIPDLDEEVCLLVAKYQPDVPRAALAFARDMMVVKERSGCDSWEEVAKAVALFVPLGSAPSGEDAKANPNADQSDLTTDLSEVTASDLNAAVHELVLSHWIRTLENRIKPDDQIAEVACCEAMMAALKQRGVEVTTLTSNEHKLKFSRLAEHAREVRSTASSTARQKLQEFKESCDAYTQAVSEGIKPFSPTSAPVWEPGDQPPQWTQSEPPPPFEPQPEPEWIPGVEPCPKLLPVPERPATVPPPRQQPSLPSTRGVKTVKEEPYSIAMFISNGATAEAILQSTGFDPAYVAAFIACEGEVSRDGTGEIDGKVVPINPDNDWPITADNVPSAAGTEERFPLGGSLWRTMMGIPPEWRACREYEEALRGWAASVRAYDAHQHDLAEWDKQCADIKEENTRIIEEVYPDQLQRFREGEMVRRAEWQRSCEEHAKAEQERRAEWDQSVAEYTEAEHQRRAEWERKCEEHAEQQQRHKREWETALSQHENDERRRQDEWNVRLQELCTRLTTLGGRINALINEHPDIELLGARVDVLRDVESVQARAGVSTQSG